MNRNVKQIIAFLLKDSEITASWGISNIRITHDAVAFSVEAMKYKGNVTIKAASNKSCIVAFEDGIDILCKYDALVEIIDKKIESSQNYTEEILKWLYNIL